MKQFITCLFLLPLFCMAQDKKISVNDFKAVYGNWKGTITYLDYTSGKPFSMPANISIGKIDKQRLQLAFSYPKESQANGNDTLIISNNGKGLDGAMVTNIITSAEGDLVIATEKAGVDGNDNRSATIRHIYSIGSKSFVSRKEVRFNGEQQFITRNEFRMTERIQ